ncbi:hypothetical protein SAMN05421788_105177 [Filimonas lacunae]|uniref:Uncharacterized protein n=1 Tax=Filimonas lacunae TaxID=477680 RepID=A0A173MD51_9BACT|nr:type VI secretion system TssO [Filimonas lacunae]BAV05368.1 hypothetical protein FLA_1375 [Filimonas lacunae]SIT21683.1 hypothetical protein SAMN05421788_105177 [Filimonas lacunae]
MEAHISMEQKERQQHFIYLLLLTLCGVVLLSVIFLRKMDSPFKNDMAFEMYLLEEHQHFNARQQDIAPFMSKTFDKIEVLPISQLQGFSETDITNSIADIASITENKQITDIRKENYGQIALFYKMYFADKKIAFAKLQNITQYEKQYTECSIGFKEKEQQLSQKNAAIAARSN